MNERDDKNELSDIVLNKTSSSNSNKKIILAVATLGVILIVVVMLMNTLSSDGTNNLPQAVLPPEPQKTTQAIAEQETEPLFEEVEVIQDDTPISSDTDLDKIAQKLKAQSADTAAEEEILIEEPVATPVIKPKAQPKPKKVHKTQSVKKKVAVATSGHYYIQVGSFSKYEPNKHFLKKITNLGFNYKYHKVKSINKVLVGPFKTRKEANRAKKVLRAKVEPGAFLVKL
jgi:DedD protein